jgi:peptide/nickel transport system substrate-binding protein
MKSFRPMAAVLGAAALVAALAACAGGGSSGGGSSASTGNGTLTIGTANSYTFDPAQATQGDSVPFYQAVYDSLIRITPDGKLVPMLATTWSYNPTKTVLTLAIRSGVKFSDGTMLTPAAVKTNLDRFRTGNGPDASTMSSVTSVSVNGDSVVLKLSAPDPSLLGYLADEDSFIASPKAIASGQIASAPVGTGPYTLAPGQTVTGSVYTFTKTQGYWDPSLQKYGTLVLKPLGNPSAQLNALLSGQVDAVLLTPQTAAAAKGAGMTEHSFTQAWQGLFLFDRQGKVAPALANVKVRQAINLAIDKTALLKTQNNGFGAVTSQLLPPGVPGYIPSLDSAYPYDPAKAKQLMAEAGYAKGFTLTMPNVPAAMGTTLAAVLAQELGAIGIAVNYQNVQAADFYSDLTSGKFAASWFGYSMGTAYYTAGVLYSTNAIMNPFHTADPTVASLAKTLQTGSPAQQMSAATQLNRYITGQAWFAPFFRLGQVFFTNSKTNVELQPLQPDPSIYNYSPKS